MQPSIAGRAKSRDYWTAVPFVPSSFIVVICTSWPAKSQKPPPNASVRACVRFVAAVGTTWKTEVRL